MTFLQDYQLFLQYADPLVGAPLVVAGLLLMGFGWQLWKICVVLSFGLIGWTMGVVVADGSAYQDLFASAGLVALGFIGFRWANHAVSLLGGIAGSFLVMKLLGVMGLDGTAWWIACAVVLASLTAVSAINRNLVIVLITSVEGAMLLVSGMAVLCRFSPVFYGAARSMSSGSAVVISFLLLVPATISVFYQISETNRSGTDI